MRKKRPNVDVDAVLVDFSIAYAPDRRGRYSQCRSVLACVGYSDPRDDHVVESPDFKQFVLDGSKQIQEPLRTGGSVRASDDRVAIGIDKRAFFRQEGRQSLLVHRI